MTCIFSAHVYCVFTFAGDQIPSIAFASEIIEAYNEIILCINTYLHILFNIISKLNKSYAAFTHMYSIL